MAEVHVKGLDQLNKFLQELPVKIERNILRSALRAGMNVVKPVAQANLHSMSGEVTLKVGTRAKGGTVTANLKARHLRKGVPDNLPIWVEYGTRAHFIHVQESERPINRRLSARRGMIVRAGMTTVNRAIRSLKIGSTFIGPTVYHPGASPRPWMRPALDATASAAVVAVGEQIKKRLTREGLDVANVLVEGDE